MTGKKKNQGTIVLEMCVIMPIVVALLMLAIYMMLMQINKSAAMGEMYSMACNREGYFLSGDSFHTSVLENQLEQNLRQQLQLAQDIRTNVTYKKASTSLVTGNKGTLCFSMQYMELHPGVALFSGDEKEQKTWVIEKQLRDTSNNLRRWQLYGAIL